jgi:hypothetical protein
MVEEIRLSQPRFLGEHDGPQERELKSRLVELFQCEGNISAAYLARVAYADDQKAVVALCLRAHRPNREVVGKVGQIFASTFVIHEHLDIMFLDGDQEGQLARCCRASWPMPQP